MADSSYSAPHCWLLDAGVYFRARASRDGASRLLPRQAPPLTCQSAEYELISDSVAPLEGPKLRIVDQREAHMGDIQGYSMLVRSFRFNPLAHQVLPGIAKNDSVAGVDKGGIP